jgi:3-dehydroquinate synthase
MSKKSKTLEIAGSQVVLGPDALSELAVHLESILPKAQSVIILADQNTADNCLKALLDQVPQFNRANRIIIEPGEENKTIQTCEKIWSQLADMGANRNSLMINLGGGVVTDIGGFAASTYHRGMPFINIPTTLMAMIDAALGGKTGVDLTSLKNIVGLFANPLGVYVWPGFLKTLPHRYLLSGYAEMLKHGIIADADFWKTITKRPMALVKNWDDFIYTAAHIKAKIVNSDPNESGKRRLLNFGHTIGHAFETYSLRHDKNPLSHGEAVAMGIICEAYISYRLVDLSFSERDNIIRNILLNFDHYHIDPSAIDELIKITLYDKKNRDGNILLTLIKKIGIAVEGQHCEAEMLRESLFQVF